jgi:uncharacterized protein YjiK
VYDLNNPTDKFRLPRSLTEISGISYYKDNIFAAVQDETGKIYLVDYNTKEVTKIIKFGKKGDYEDIQIIGNTAFVIKSTGRLYEIKNFDSENFEINQYYTKLEKRNNCEGLTYDSLSNSLLILCKDAGALNEGKSSQENRSIYSFNLKTRELIDTPVYIISSIDLERALHRPVSNKNFLGRLAEKFSNESVESILFRPSGISIHPISKEIYIVASYGKLLVIINREGIIKFVVKLDAAIFKQPEGICFNPSGELFISNEGRNGKGNILKFKER